jgi:catechol 2,3-dioxygenase-like lactoylglutathione lyase family enzyme
MIRVKKIAHATYETPDLDRQIEYYTDILGLNLIARRRTPPTSPRPSIITRWCCARRPAQCVRLGFQLGPTTTSTRSRSRPRRTASRRRARRIPSRRSPTWSTFEDPKGTVMEVFKRGAFSQPEIPIKGIVPHKLGHVAFFVKDVKSVTKFYCDVLGFRVSDWMGDFFSFLRCGTDHHTINLMQDRRDRHFHTAFELRDWGHMLTACDYLSLNGYKLLWGPGRHGIGHNLFAYHRAPNGLITELFAAARPDERGARLFRAAALAPRPAADGRRCGPRTRRVELLGYHAVRGNAQVGDCTTRAARIDAPLKEEAMAKCVGMRCARSSRRSSLDCWRSRARPRRAAIRSGSA